MQQLLEWDLALFRWANTPRGPVADALVLGAAWAGEYGMAWYALAALLLWRRRRWDGWVVGAVVAALLLSVLFTNAWKLVWDRPRPFEYLEDVRRLGQSWTNSAFPSGHAVTSFAAAHVLGVAEKRWRRPTLVLATLVALSRSYCGMHHPSDVILGVLMGMLVGRLVVWGVARLRRPRPKGGGDAGGANVGVGDGPGALSPTHGRGDGSL